MGGPRLKAFLGDGHARGTLGGTSRAIQKVREQLTRIADADVTVLLTGETGTGKDVAAHALHRHGRRRAGPFVAVNCAAMPEALVESELFGHARGAFTDARTARTGLFVQATGGTLLLDEIGDLPLALQPKLLRALEERTVRPVGGGAEIPFDVRLVTTTNRDLEAAVTQGRFREDLYFRINVIQLKLPPLRTRGSDVLLLAQEFIVRFAEHAGKRVTGLSATAAKRLRSYAWPGNIRELRNCIERAVAVTRFEEIAVNDLPETIQASHHSHVFVENADPLQLVSLAELERRHILRVMEAVGGNKARAARVLRLCRKTLYRKLEHYGRTMTPSPAARASHATSQRAPGRTTGDHEAAACNLERSSANTIGRPGASGCEPSCRAGCGAGDSGA
jgi:two-component system, NtrC family, response regulator AtoC